MFEDLTDERGPLDADALRTCAWIREPAQSCRLPYRLCVRLCDRSSPLCPYCAVKVTLWNRLPASRTVMSASSDIVMTT